MVGKVGDLRAMVPCLAWGGCGLMLTLPVALPQGYMEFCGCIKSYKSSPTAAQFTRSLVRNTIVVDLDLDHPGL